MASKQKTTEGWFSRKAADAGAEVDYWEDEQNPLRGCLITHYDRPHAVWPDAQHYNLTGFVFVNTNSTEYPGKKDA